MKNQKLATSLAVSLLGLAGLTALFASNTATGSLEDVGGILAPEWRVDLNSTTRERSHGERLYEKEQFTWQGGSLSDLRIHEGHLWLADYATQQIFQVSDHGEILRTISQEGEAPWEHQGLNQISFRGDSVYSFDNLAMKLRGFSLDGEFGGYQEPSGMFTSGTIISDENALFLESDPNNGLSFVCLNRIDGTVLQHLNISELLSDSEEFQHPDVAFQGQLIPILEGGAYFYCLKAGIIIRFDESGVPVFVNSTIDGKLPPTVSLRSSGDFLIYQEEPNYASNLSAAGSDQELLILSNLRFSEGETKRIDVYDGISGRYRHSMDVPNLEGNIFPVMIESEGDHRLTVLYEDQRLVTYKRQALMP